jgi:uncharacterized protein YbjQ (UPF0145 family)
MALFEIARKRLKEQQEISKKSGKSFFTSDLSTNEYLLVREAGCQPIGLVMGTSFYQVGFYSNFQGYISKTGEVETLTQAQIAARENAVSRMQEEAAMLGAHGIIGVRLQQGRKGWGTAGMVEFTAIGTAIKIPNYHSTNKPFTSDLSGQEFWQLRQAGYWPKGLVFGACSYYVHSDRTTRNLMNPTLWNRLFGQSRRNQELIQLTQGFQNAREIAIMRLAEEIQQLGAIGAVGMHIEKREEVITYQPWNKAGCFFGLFFLGLFISVFITMAIGHSTASTILFFLLFFSVILSVIISSIIGIFQNRGPFRDILTNFVAIGTAIVKDDSEIQKPINTLMFLPLSKT